MRIKAKYFLGLILSFFIIVFLVVYIEWNCLYLSIENHGYESVRVNDIDITNGVVFNIPKLLKKNEIESFLSCVFRNDARIEISVKNGSDLEYLICNIHREGSDGCHIDVNENVVMCECYR